MGFKDAIKILLLWVLSFFLVDILLPPLLIIVNPQLPAAIFKTLGPYISTYIGQLSAISLVISGMFVGSVVWLDDYFKSYRTTAPVIQTRPRNSSTLNVPSREVPPVQSNQAQTAQRKKPVTRSAPLQRRRSKPALELLSFRLITENNGEIKLSTGKNVNSGTTIRPAIAVRVNDKTFVSKSLTLQFDLVNPEGRTLHSLVMKPVLKFGVNIITSIDSGFKISDKAGSGVWAMHLWAGPYQWGQLIFTIRGAILQALSDHIGPDMEMDDEALVLANEAAQNFSVEDLFRF